MIAPAVHAILFFATTLLPEHLCKKNFLSDAVLTFCHLQNFLELLLSTLNYGIIFAHNVNVKRYFCTCTCVGIHPGRVEPASAIALTTSRTEAFQARRSCASPLDTFTQSFLHRAWPKTRGPEIGSRSALVVVAHVFSWPPVRLRHVRGGVGRRRSLISSPSGRLAA